MHFVVATSQRMANWQCIHAVDLKNKNQRSLEECSVCVLCVSVRCCVRFMVCVAQTVAIKRKGPMQATKMRWLLLYIFEKIVCLSWTNALHCIALRVASSFRFVEWKMPPKHNDMMTMIVGENTPKQRRKCLIVSLLFC